MTDMVHEGNKRVKSGTKECPCASGMGADGKYTKELWVNRRENSKSLTWSSVWRAFEKTEGKPVVARPKDLGDIRGISYIYGIFYRFGLIEVPEQVRVKMAE